MMQYCVKYVLYTHVSAHTQPYLTFKTVGKFIFTSTYFCSHALLLKWKYSVPSGSFQFLSPLSATSTADSVTVTWMPPKLSPTGYMLNTTCSWPCDDDTALPHTTPTPGPADTSATITGLLPGSMCTITLTALYGDIISDTMTTQSETPAHGTCSKIHV